MNTHALNDSCHFLNRKQIELVSVEVRIGCFECASTHTNSIVAIISLIPGEPQLNRLMFTKSRYFFVSLEHAFWLREQTISSSTWDVCCFEGTALYVLTD